MLKKRSISLLLILCLLAMPLAGVATATQPNPLFSMLERAEALVDRLSRLSTDEVSSLLLLFETKAATGYDAMFTVAEEAALRNKGVTPEAIQAALADFGTSYAAAFPDRITTDTGDLITLAEILLDVRAKHFVAFRTAARTEGRLNLDIFLEILLTMTTLRLDSLNIPESVSEAWLATLLREVPPANQPAALKFLTDHGISLSQLNDFFDALNPTDRAEITRLLQKAGVITTPAAPGPGPGPVLPPTPALPGVTMTADPVFFLAQLADPAVTQIVIALPTTTELNREINVPVQILQAALTAGKSVVLDFGTVRITLPSGALTAALLSPGATARMQVNQLPANIPAPAGMTKSGPVLEFLFHVVRDGVATPVTAFSRPVTLHVPFAGLAVTAGEMDKLGLYRQTGNTWTYVGGRADGATQQLIVELDRFSRYRVMLYDKTFADIRGHWAQNVIEVMASRHIVRGMAADSFAPSVAITRAQVAVLLVRALNLSAGSPVNFNDVRAGAWFYNDIQTAAQAGLLRGYPDGTFKPNQPVTREELAVIMVRAARLQGQNVTIAPNETTKTLDDFNDHRTASRWAQAELDQAVKMGLIRGLPGNILAPRGQSSRAQGSVMLYRLLRAVNHI